MADVRTPPSPALADPRTTQNDTVNYLLPVPTITAASPAALRLEIGRIRRLTSTVFVFEHFRDMPKHCVSIPSRHVVFNDKWTVQKAHKCFNTVSVTAILLASIITVSVA